MWCKSTVSLILVLGVLAGLAQAQLITAVAHRNTDTDAPEAPQIAPTPLVEDAPCFVDRTHQYNEIPEHYIGAEYVMLANDNKNQSAYELDITLSGNATLYVFVDNRMGGAAGGLNVAPNIAGMPWLTNMGFVDTGDDIGIDESADGDIDQYSSIFALEVEAGTVTIGGCTQGHGGNMYGVAALPRAGGSKAYDPVPEDGATDVPRDIMLGWQPGDTAAAHDVYLGDDFADVNNADIADATGVLVSPGQTGTTYQPAELLAYGQTYYWRVDEVNAPPDATVFKGDIWSFTVEPYAYPITNITATASSAQAGMGPENTINGSGLNADGQHSVDAKQMWLSTGVQPNWIQYKFDRIYRLHELRVWNSNQLIETFIGFGAKDVTVEYSTDGATWTALADVPQFARATALPTYVANTTVDFGGILAQQVRLTINSTWGGIPQCGLSEVQFSYVPVQAREPEPAGGATGVALDATLNWRPGREAVSHAVYFGTDVDAVTNGTAAVENVTDHRLTPTALEFGITYYWRVDEVGETATYPGEVWSFTTQEYAVVDDFESYTDDEGSRIYETWIDGYTDGLSNSIVGYFDAPFAEQTIVFAGNQSMPIEYNNVNTPFFSEAYRDFAPVQNWTAKGADTLFVHFQGRAPAFLERSPGSFIVGGGGTDIWNTADQFRFVFKRLSGNGSIIAKVDSLVDTNAWAKVGVMIRESLDPGSKFAAVYATPGNGVRYQARLTATVNAVSDTGSETPEQVALRAPVWVKMERSGNNFTGSYSTDGKTWTTIVWSPQTIVMTSPTVYIGLAVTSHNATAVTTAEFSGVVTTGGVTGVWDSAAIGAVMPSNTPAPLYVMAVDSANKSKVVTHPDPGATATAAWQRWEIPLSSFAGVNTSKVKALYIGVGDRANPAKDGAGMLYIDDIGVGRPVAGQ